MDGWLDLGKFRPVFYRTMLPYSDPAIKVSHAEQGKGIADHMLSLDY